ncbi:18472_t:CDS:1, partial [Racocetra fulgida]
MNTYHYYITILIKLTTIQLIDSDKTSGDKTDDTTTSGNKTGGSKTDGN